MDDESNLPRIGPYRTSTLIGSASQRLNEASILCRKRFGAFLRVREKCFAFFWRPYRESNSDYCLEKAVS